MKAYHGWVTLWTYFSFALSVIVMQCSNGDNGNDRYQMQEVALVKTIFQPTIDDGFWPTSTMFFSVDVSLRYFSANVSQAYFWSMLAIDVFWATLTRAFLNRCHRGCFLANNDQDFLVDISKDFILAKASQVFFCRCWLGIFSYWCRLGFFWSTSIESIFWPTLVVAIFLANVGQDIFLAGVDQDFLVYIE